MIQTTNIPFDESQVLDAFFGPSKDTRWHSPISQKDFVPFNVSATPHQTVSALSIKDIEPITF